MLSQSEFVELVARLREKQREFFATRLPNVKATALAAAKQLEAEVDEAVKEYRQPPLRQHRSNRPVEGECEYGSNRH